MLYVVYFMCQLSPNCSGALRYVHLNNNIVHFLFEFQNNSVFWQQIVQDTEYNYQGGDQEWSVMKNILLFYN